MRLLARRGDDIWFVPGLNAWIVWDGDHWVWDRDAARVRCMTGELHLDIYAEARQAPRADVEHFLKWARQCQTKSVIASITALAAGQISVRLPIDAIDGDPLVVGIDGARQVIDLTTGNVRPAARDDLVTRSLAVSHLGNACEAKRWRSFLDEVFEGDAELIAWLKRFLGYCLTGLNREHVFVFAHGAGANGKTVLLNVCQAIWGDYGRTIQPETLMAQVRSGSAPSPDVARLAGARLVQGSETEEGRPLAEALLKQLTGGDTITARDMYSRPFEFTPRFKLMLAGNHRPRIKGTDNGIWRRIRLLPFNRTFAGEQRDPGLTAALIAEAPHILAWLVEGCRDYLEEGLDPVPSSIAAATAGYRQEEDVVGRWFAERVSRDGEALSSHLYADYRTWAEASGERALSLQAFGRRLTAKGIATRHTRNGQMYRGISLRGAMM
ncbi:MAG: DNA primase family protein [Caulobacteraceae bacterium]